MSKPDNPGVYIPPPIIYAIIFIAALMMQKYWPISNNFFRSTISDIPGFILILTGILFGLPSLIQFFKTRNTVITVKPANSLQTTGMYRISRNPMYVGLTAIYCGLAFIFGNWWHFILLPLLIWIVTEFIIKSEERYLQRRFGQAFLDYKMKTRRWF